MNFWNIFKNTNYKHNIYNKLYINKIKKNFFHFKISCVYNNNSKEKGNNKN